MYCTVKDIENAISYKKLAQQTDDNNGLMVNELIVNSLIQSNSNTIDDYLRGRYTLPLCNTHDTLKNLCKDLTVYELSKRRNTTTDEIRKSFEDAHDMLTKIQKGIMILDEGSKPIEQAGSTAMYVTSSRSVFSRTIEQFNRRFR